VLGGVADDPSEEVMLVWGDNRAAMGTG
jgi:hypothetical protein